MKISFKDHTDISEVLKFNTGIKPIYGKGTMKGCAWCSCRRCVCNLLLFKNNTVVGFLETECSCGNKIDYSDADKYL